MAIAEMGHCLARRALLLLVLSSGGAGAQQQEFGPYRRPPAEEDDVDDGLGSRATRLATGDYVHDGFYLRLGGGIGGGNDKLSGSARDSDGFSGQIDGGVNAFAGATQLALGVTVARGWVLALSIDTVSMLSGEGRLTDSAGRFGFGTSQLALFGAMADYYPDPLRGFHLQAALGLASFVMAQGEAVDNTGYEMIAPPHAAIGAGFSLGVGNQWWVHPDWTVGVLGRFMMGWADGSDEYGASFSHRALGYSLLLTTTYH